MERDFQASITAGFEILRERGYFAEEEWSCCQTCGVAALPKGVTHYVFYTDQDADDLVAEHAVYLNWGGSTKEIIEAFRDVGLNIEWDGSESTRIRVKEPQPTRH